MAFRDLQSAPGLPGRDESVRATSNPEGLARDSLAQSICTRVLNGARTHDELRVIDDVLAGLEHGAETIGPLDLSKDDRDWREEAAQECRDLLAYMAMHRVAAAHRRRERLRCELSDQAAELVAAQANADGGCSCRSSTVPCTLHPNRDSIVEGLRSLRDATITQQSSDFEHVQAEIERVYREVGGEG